jgi:hypothetical protein
VRGLEREGALAKFVARFHTLPPFTCVAPLSPRRWMLRSCVQVWADALTGRVCCWGVSVQPPPTPQPPIMSCAMNTVMGLKPTRASSSQAQTGCSFKLG